MLLRFQRRRVVRAGGRAMQPAHSPTCPSWSHEREPPHESYCVSCSQRTRAARAVHSQPSTPPHDFCAFDPVAVLCLLKPLSNRSVSLLSVQRGPAVAGHRESLESALRYQAAQLYVPQQADTPATNGAHRLVDITCVDLVNSASLLTFRRGSGTLACQHSEGSARARGVVMAERGTPAFENSVGALYALSGLSERRFRAHYDVRRARRRAALDVRTRTAEHPSATALHLCDHESSRDVLGIACVLAASNAEAACGPRRAGNGVVLAPVHRQLRLELSSPRLRRQLSKAFVAANVARRCASFSRHRPRAALKARDQRCANLVSSRGFRLHTVALVADDATLCVAVSKASGTRARDVLSPAPCSRASGRWYSTHSATPARFLLLSTPNDRPRKSRVRPEGRGQCANACGMRVPACAANAQPSYRATAHDLA